jgi:hypothetical protein
LGTKHQHAVVAQLVVLDDGERLEGFAEADAVGDDAAAEALQLVDRADNAVALELVELLPDDGVAMPVADLTIRSSSSSSPEVLERACK